MLPCGKSSLTSYGLVLEDESQVPCVEPRALIFHAVQLLLNVKYTPSAMLTSPFSIKLPGWVSPFQIHTLQQSGVSQPFEWQVASGSISWQVGPVV